MIYEEHSDRVHIIQKEAIFLNVIVIYIIWQEICFIWQLKPGQICPPRHDDEIVFF